MSLGSLSWSHPVAHIAPSENPSLMSLSPGVCLHIDSTACHPTLVLAFYVDFIRLTERQGCPPDLDLMFDKCCILFNLHYNPRRYQFYLHFHFMCEEFRKFNELIGIWELDI